MPDNRQIVAEPCTVWRGATTTGGYGQVRRYGKLWLLHRLTWFHAHGEIPDGNVVRHLCHNPACYNLNHLVLGTQVENSADAIERGTRSSAGTSKACLRYHRYNVSEKGRAKARREKRIEKARTKQRERDRLRRAAGHDVRPVEVKSEQDINLQS